MAADPNAVVAACRVKTGVGNSIRNAEIRCAAPHTRADPQHNPHGVPGDAPEDAPADDPAVTGTAVARTASGQTAAGNSIRNGEIRRAVPHTRADPRHNPQNVRGDAPQVAPADDPAVTGTAAPRTASGQTAGNNVRNAEIRHAVPEARADLRHNPQDVRADDPQVAPADDPAVIGTAAPKAASGQTAGNNVRNAEIRRAVPEARADPRHNPQDDLVGRLAGGSVAGLAGDSVDGSVGGWEAPVAVAERITVIQTTRRHRSGILCLLVLSTADLQPDSWNNRRQASIVPLVTDPLGTPPIRKPDSCSAVICGLP